jgi:septum formation protein
MKKIVLASGSPRRKELFAQLGLTPTIWSSDIPEMSSTTEKPESIAKSLALQKALRASNIFEDSLIIAADTIVVLDGSIMGKPRNNGEAFEMLKALSGRSHEVITGIAIIDSSKGSKVVEYEKTIVTFRNLENDRINSYIDTGEVLDKAGAYGIQGKGALLVEKIEGCYFNVVGLPLTKLESCLEKYFDTKFL